MTIYLTGSLAYDRIMNFGGNFDDHILPQKIHSINVSFFIERLDEHLGGCAGNIAYTLALLGVKGMLVSAAGRDFARCREHFEALGLDLSGVSVMESELTAGAYIITDQKNNQITGFNAGAMKYPAAYTFPDLAPGDIGIVSPTNPEDMRVHPRLLKAKGARCIFDPGQQIPALSADAMLEALAGSFMLICNDYELEMICNSTGKTPAEIRALTSHRIVTLGEKGSRLETGGREIHIPCVPVTAQDPTGAGDAYRSGLLYGLYNKLSLEDCAKLGATAASYCVEKQGTQEHSFTKAEFDARHKAHFG